MTPNLLVGVDDFTEAHLDDIKTAANGWVTVEQVKQGQLASGREKASIEATIVMGWPNPERLLSGPCEFLQLPSVGYDQYVGKGFAERAGFRLSNASGVMSIPVAEHWLAMALALTRHIDRHVEDRRLNRWQRCESYRELHDTVLCVVGLGSIGTEVARRGLALGMRVIGVRQHPERGHDLVKDVYSTRQLEEVLPKADHVVSLLPDSAATRGLFGQRLLGRCRPGAFFYDLGRGSVVDEAALVECLRSGHLGGAGLDVFETEPLPEGSALWNLDNVIITPHSAGRSIREFDRMCNLFVENLGALREGRIPRNVVPSENL